jgi:hypothetical protein
MSEKYFPKSQLTPFQRVCARSWHHTLGVYGTEQLYALYLSQNKKLIAAQAENEILRQKLARAGVPLD